MRILLIITSIYLWKISNLVEKHGSVWDEKTESQCIKMKCTLKNGLYSADPIRQSKSYSVIIDMKEKLKDIILKSDQKR
jgi:hypothetical protein